MSGNYSFGVVGRTFDYYSIEYSSYDYYWIEYSFGMVTKRKNPGRGVAWRTDFRLPRLARYILSRNPSDETEQNRVRTSDRFSLATTHTVYILDIF